MFRVDNATSVSPIPTPGPVGPNPDSFFADGSTVLPADWLNAVQEEMANVIEDTGATLSKTDRTQLLTAIDSKVASGTSGQLTASNMLHVRDEKPNNTDGGTFTLGAWRTRDFNTVARNTITGAYLLYELPYDNKTLTFQVGETVTGGTSGATAVVWSLNGGVSPLTVYNISGTFVDNEQITGGTSGATADVDNLTPEDSATGLDYGNQVLLPSGDYIIYARCPAFSVSRHKAKLRNITDGSDEIIGSTEVMTGNTSNMTPSFVKGFFTIAAQKVFELQHRSEQTDAFGLASNFSVIEVYSEAIYYKVG